MTSMNNEDQTYEKYQNQQYIALIWFAFEFGPIGFKSSLQILDHFKSLSRYEILISKHYQ